MKTCPKGIVGAPVTPFTPDGRVDLGTFAKQVKPFPFIGYGYGGEPDIERISPWEIDVK